MRLTALFFALLLVPRSAVAQQPTYHPYVPSDGFVPDSATAVNIAVAVWTPIYGDVQFMTQHPVTATLTDGIWTVTSAVPSNRMVNGYIFIINGKEVAQSLSVDTAVVKIAKRDGRILYQGRT